MKRKTCKLFRAAQQLDALDRNALTASWLRWDLQYYQHWIMICSNNSIDYDKNILKHWHGICLLFVSRLMFVPVFPWEASKRSMTFHRLLQFWKLIWCLHICNAYINNILNNLWSWKRNFIRNSFHAHSLFALGNWIDPRIVAFWWEREEGWGATRPLVFKHCRNARDELHWIFNLKIEFFIIAAS